MASDGHLAHVRPALVTVAAAQSQRSVTEPSTPRVSVVVPTRNRPLELERCLRALDGQETDCDFEVVVVNDGGTMRRDLSAVVPKRQTRLLQGGGRGPAAARNLGLRASSGAIVLFTDDDTIPEPLWVDAAWRFLEEHSGHVGVSGPIESPPYDYLYEHSIEADRVSFWTSNIAYRRSALDQLGGFCEDFIWPHCEDLDLGYRSEALGPIGFAPQMRVRHPARSVSLWQLVKRGRYASSELQLYARHPQRYRIPRGVPLRALPVLRVALTWTQHLRCEGRSIIARPRRLLRLAGAAAGEFALTAATVAMTRLPKAQ